MFHSVSQFSEEGNFIQTFDCINDAIKTTGVNRSSILQQIDGKRKYCFWHSHIYRNNITLYNGKVIEIKRSHLSIREIECIGFMSKSLKDLGLKIVKDN